MATRILLSKAREDFAATVNRAGYHHQRVVLQRNGRDFAAIIPIEDLALLEAAEDRADIAAAKKARRETSIPWELAKKRLNHKR